MTLVQKFTEKYGKNPITLVEEANLKNFGLAKTWGLERLLKEYVDTDDIKLVNDEFIKELVECFAEAKEKFPEGIKAPELVGANFEIPNQKASIPKSKGTLENFKDIVGKDELRPVMSGVYVAEDGFLVGTDAHKLIKLKTNEYSADKGKIIDLTKFIKSNGKILDFIDGKYPNYEQVIPKDNLKEGGLTTYAFYNLAKSAQEVKRLISNEIFNINIKLKTEEGETEVFAFSYLIMLEALTFAMANGWDFFTLEYSKPTRAVVLNFGDENIALVMPVMTRDRVLGAKTMTPDEIEENYRLGLTNQKSSKPAKAPKKPVMPSAPVSSEPFEKYTGELKDTSYIHRSNIESITLTNGEVLGKNDIIDGFYRVNKKMAQGGGVSDSNKQFVVKVFTSTNPKTPIEEAIVSEETKSNATYFVVTNLEPNWMKKYGDSYLGFEITTKKMAQGGGISGGMSSGDISFLQKNGYYFDGEFYFEADGEFIEVVQGTSPNNPRKVAVLFRTNEPITISRAMLDKIASSFGKDFEIELFTNAGVDLHSSANGKYKNIRVERLPHPKMEDGGSVDDYVYAGKTKSLGLGQFGAMKSVYKKGDNYYTKDGENYKFFSSSDDLHNKIFFKMEHGGSMYADGGSIETITLDKMIERINNNYNGVKASKTYSDNKVEVISPYFNTLQEIKRKEFNNNALLQKYGNTSQFILYSNSTFPSSNPMSSGYEVGDTVTFNSVLGGTKTGTIISKMGDEGFRVRIGDGFATIKKSAIV